MIYVLVLLWTIATVVNLATAPSSTSTATTTIMNDSNSNGSTCRKSEYRCQNGKCIVMNRYCNNVNDCGDASDEPRFCTPCNRTYYGDIGKTYELNLHRPREDKVPYICYLTFTANGGDYGDLVQLTFDSFTVGRFVSFTQDGCPDGSLQIWETNRPQVGGSWCGTSWGPAIFYSETHSVTIAVNLLRLNKDQNGYNFDFRMQYKILTKNAATVRYGDSTSDNKGTFPWNVTADVPITNSNQESSEYYYLGDLITGTYCSRIFRDCDRKVCRLQSPNYPGIYPRNLTCYYAVRQHEIPPGKYALITVRQPKGQLISIRSQSALYGTTKTRELKMWSDCDDVQDYVTIYDGYTTRDPVILKFCGGGEAVPEAVSSGHELLVEFTTSPYGTFLHPTPVQSLHGFQLEVQVKFVDKDSPTYIKNKRNCEFWIRGTKRGILESPLHSLMPNTTCIYHLQGIDMSVSQSPIPFRPLAPSRYQDNMFWRRSDGFPAASPPRYRVWLSLVKFHMSTTAALNPAISADQTPCASNLNVWDGQLKVPSNCNDLFCNRERVKYVSRVNLSNGLQLASPSASSTFRNGTTTTVLLARYCQNYIPRSCDHSLLTTTTITESMVMEMATNETKQQPGRLPRPCSIAESFLSTGDSLTLELKVAESTALRPVTFRALYEFVDTHIDGEPYGSSNPCWRRFTSSQHTANSEELNSQIKFQAPKNIFLYGRGGAINISCVYRFEGQRDERIKLTLTRVQIDQQRKCQTFRDINTDRWQCYGNKSATVQIYELPWNDVPGVPKDCFCSSVPTSNNYVYVSTSETIELHFNVIGMNAVDDYDSFYFEGSVKFVRMPVCKKSRRKMGANGEVVFQTNSNEQQQSTCENYPLVITPTKHHYLYVKVNGILVKSEPWFKNTSTPRPRDCYTSNRIVVYTGTRALIVCPARDHDPYHRVVEIFSDGWLSKTMIGSTSDQMGFEPSNSIVLEFIGKESGTHVAKWLELSRKRLMLTSLGLVRPEECPYRCPELNACINASVWCDGITDCPSGYDEALTHCSFLLQLPPVYLALSALCLLAFFGTVCTVAYRRCRRRPRSVLQTRLKSLSSSDTAIIDEKGLIC